MLRVKFAKQLIPQSLLNGLLLTFPSLYKTRFVNYESYLHPAGIRLLREAIDVTEGCKGDIVECGCARCGTTVILANYLRKIGSHRKIIALDSFGKGFQEDDLKQDLMANAIDYHHSDFRYNSFHYAERKVKKLGLEDWIVLKKGFFSSTLPRLGVPLSMALIDCDVGATVDFCLSQVFPALSHDGMILVDDYGSTTSRGVKPAVDSFVTRYGTGIRLASQKSLFVVTKA